MKKGIQGLDQQVAKIREKLGHFSLEWVPDAWLNLGSPELNEVLGHREKGMPYGRIMEVSGMEAQGKTALCLTLAAVAQRDGALVVWDDLENSFDPHWAKVRGLDPANMVLIQPYVGKFGTEKKPRMSTVQELCAETEAVIEAIGGGHKCIMVVDSVPAMLTEGEANAGVEGRSMRTNMELPMFLSALLRRWVGMAQSRNVLIVFINQLRVKPLAFGDPFYCPGGNSLPFYAHIRVRVRRIKGGRIIDAGKQIGIQGVLRNMKNKAGGRERCEVGYKLLFEGPMEFLAVSKLETSDE